MKHYRSQREEGVAMIMAILIMVVLLSLVATMTAFALMGVDKGKDVQFLTGSQNAADSAISHAMMVVNSTSGQVEGKGLDAHIGVANAVYGKVSANEIDPDSGDGAYNWRWYAEKIVGTKNNMSYDIVATGYSQTPDDDTARTYRVRVEAMVVESATYNGDIPLYFPTRVGMFAWGVLGIEKVSVGTGSEIKMYDSSKNIGYPVTGTAVGGRFATNNIMELNPNVKAAEFVFLSGTGPIDNTRCTRNCGDYPLMFESFGISLNTATTMAASACPLAASAYSDWVASAHSGVVSYSATPMCYRNIIFDVDTNLAANWTSARPAEMYAKGNITVKAGVEVNKQTKGFQGPLALRVYSQTGATGTLEQGTASNPTKFTGLIAGETMACSVGTASNALEATVLYGAISCKTVTLGSNSKVWWDNQIEQVTELGSPTSKKLWSIKGYQEV
ncbi:MAG: hypothetical protein H9W81_12860 [Enterococcus sp.]|nr:hypothetical protein [Enterococcus sp.]